VLKVPIDSLSDVVNDEDEEVRAAVRERLSMED
jgi:hypothetical protein